MLKLLFSLSGFLFGILLAVISPEELRPGKKYFRFIRNILFSSILVFVVVLIFNHKFSFFSFGGSTLILASLIFLYGLPAGTLFRLKQIEKQERKYRDAHL